MTVLLNPTVQRLETADERYSHDDFMRLAPDDHKAELIDGEIIIRSAAVWEHERLQGFLMAVLMGYVSHFELGTVLGSRSAVYISESDTYEPDILFIAQGREYIITKHKIMEAPDLVVEILSTTTARHDRGIKLQNYARAGVREVWLIDPYGPAGTQFFQRQADVLVEVAAQEGILLSAVLPSFRLKTAWLWPDASGRLPNPMLVLRELGVF